MKKIINLITLFTVFLIFCGPAFVSASEIITGKVIKVMDGDTIKIEEQSSGQIYKIRFACIDAPESKQEYGQESRQFLAGLIYNKDVSVNILNTDMYGRKVGLVYQDGNDINGSMLLNGYAWHYGQYDHTKMKQQYTEYEQNAREQKIGLWAQDNPKAPWQWRKENK